VIISAGIQLSCLVRSSRLQVRWPQYLPNDVARNYIHRVKHGMWQARLSTLMPMELMPCFPEIPGFAVHDRDLWLSNAWMTLPRPSENVIDTSWLSETSSGRVWSSIRAARHVTYQYKSHQPPLIENMRKCYLKMSSPRVFAIRHGETEWSLAHRHTGGTDVDLAGIGIQQIEAIGRASIGMNKLISPMKLQRM
jgi:hypothetical protein